VRSAQVAAFAGAAGAHIAASMAAKAHVEIESLPCIASLMVRL
jgi:hypothetical protein